MPSTRFYMMIEWSVPIGQARPLTMALHSVAAEIRSIRGCVGCSVTTDLGNRSTVRYTEAWETEEHLRSRTQSDTFSHLFMLIEDAIQRPLIEFGIGRETRGFDFVTEVRASTG